MAVKGGLGQSALAAIRQGFTEVKAMIAEKTEPANLRGLVRDLRRIPTADRDKKRTLAEFFQTLEGQKYSREERHDAYNQVLGKDRNTRQRG